MKRLSSIICLIILFQITSFAQRHVEIVKFEWYKHQREVQNDTTYILNFWASWCMPCIQELPEIEKLQTLYKDQKVKVILVNLDSYKKLHITIIPFLDKTNIQSEVVLLDEPNYNKWINKVDKTWSGSIPATVIFNNKNHYYHFVEGETTASELSGLINESTFEYK